MSWDELNLVSDFVSQLCKYVPGGVAWIAKQDTDDPGEWWGFVIGNKYADVEIEQVKNSSDAFVREVATRMLGYAPGSFEDMQFRLQRTRQELEKAHSQLVTAQNYVKSLRETEQKLVREMADHVQKMKDQAQ